MNSVDVAMTKLRELQQLFFHADSSPNSLFKKSEEVARQMQNASKEINMNYRDISDKLTKHMNTGKVQE